MTLMCTLTARQRQLIQQIRAAFHTKCLEDEDSEVAMRLTVLVAVLVEEMADLAEKGEDVRPIWQGFKGRVERLFPWFMSELAENGEEDDGRK